MGPVISKSEYEEEISSLKRYLNNELTKNIKLIKEKNLLENANKSLIYENGQMSNEIKQILNDLKKCQKQIEFELTYWKHLHLLKKSFIEKNNISWMDDTFELEFIDKIIDFIMKDHSYKKKENIE